MLPYPRSRYHVVTLDGIGGVGKSALALECAYRYRDSYAQLAPDERFDVIIWVSAKRTLLTASGIQQRQQTFNTLNDLYREIATVLEQPAILQAEVDQRRGLVERALANQRTLLIVDNLETVDDEELLTFLRELPDPTKAIVTTRHWLDIAYVIRLTGMPENDASILMAVEAARKKVELPVEHTGDLYRRTGGIPLAIVWSIGLMSLGHGVEAVLRRLGSGHSDIARFCFTESASQIRGCDAERLLLALSLFDTSVNRTMLGDVAGLSGDEIGRDDGLVELEQLSLINKEADRFSLLPLTRVFVLEELANQSEVERELRQGWIHHLTAFAQPYLRLYWRWLDHRLLRREGPHLVALVRWAQEVNRSDIPVPIFPALAFYYDMTAQWSEMISLGRSVLEYARLIGNLEIIIYVQTHALGWIYSQQGAHKEAESAIVDALNAAERLGDVSWQCAILGNYSQVLRRQKLFDQALEKCREAQRLLPSVREELIPYIQADIDYEIGKIARDQGDWDAARNWFLKAQSIFRLEESESIVNNELAFSILSNLGFVAQQLGDIAQAEQFYLQCINYYTEVGGKGDLATTLVRFALLEEKRNNRNAALRYVNDALQWSRHLGMVEEQAQAEAILQRLGCE